MSDANSPQRIHERYSRQALFAPLGPEGQRRLLASSAVVMGCGALGSGAAHHLARAGVGRLRLIDRDRIEWSNLARQELYREEDVRNSLFKAEAAAAMIQEINSDVRVQPIVSDVDETNIDDLLSDADVVVDGADNMEMRFIVNAACVRHRIPWVYGGAVAATGMTMTILPGRSACLQCVIDELPPPGAVKTANDVGVLNTLTGIVSAIESNEAIKILAGAGAPNADLLRIDVWNLTFKKSRVHRRPDCPVCGERSSR